jgi:hypothetical protein
LKEYYSLTKIKVNPYINFAKFTHSNANNLSKGLALFFSRNVSSENTFGTLDIFSPDKVNALTNFETAVDNIFSRRIILQKALKVNLLKKMLTRHKNVFKRKFLKFSNFKTKLLKKDFIFKKYFSHIKSITAGKYKSFKIKLKRRYFNNKTFFLNILSI